MIQSALNEVFGHYLEFGPSDQVDIAYLEFNLLNELLGSVIKVIGGGVSKFFLVLTCYHLLVLWSQELFTESKNFAPVSRYDVSKLATTRRFCPKIAPKGGQIAIF